MSERCLVISEVPLGLVLKPLLFLLYRSDLDSRISNNVSEVVD